MRNVPSAESVYFAVCASGAQLVIRAESRMRVYLPAQPCTNWETGWCRELVGPALHVLATAEWHRRYPQFSQWIAERADELMCILDGQQCYECGDFDRGRYCQRPRLCDPCRIKQHLRWAEIAERNQ